MKRNFLDIYLTTLFAARKFKNTSGVRNCSKLNLSLKYVKKKKEKMFLVSEIIASENVAINCLFSEENTSFRQSVRQQRVLRYWESFRQTFKPELVSKGARNVVKLLSFIFQQCFRPFNVLLVERSSETGVFRHLSNHVFQSPYVQKYISYEGHFLLKMFKLECKFTKCKKSVDNIFRF